MSTLLFVHIGTPYPRYLLKNIERTRRIFENHKIALIGDESPDGNWLEKHRVHFKMHEINAVFDANFSFGEFERNFRSGYWRYTLERLLSLEAYHCDFPDEKLVHLESDVILFPNFPFEEIDGLSKVTWMDHSSSGDIASIVFSPSWFSSKEFARQLIEEHSYGGGSDMDVLLRLRKKSSKFAILPTLNEATRVYSNTKFENSTHFASSETHQFPGIFDAAGIGMWISGIDPRNNFGFTVIHARELIDSGVILIDPSKMNFYFSEEGNLFVRTNETDVPIYNLHIHSKDKDLLSPEWKERIGNLLTRSKCKRIVIRFSPSIFCNLVKLNIVNRSFKSFLLQVPLVSRAKSRYSRR
jgi:hypothetical protein